MFYKLIQDKVNRWFAAADCPMREVMDYIVRRGMMRDAQVDAIKTFLFLKVACDNRPLWQLFAEGIFNGESDDYDHLALSVEARETLKGNQAAEALFQFARMRDRNGKPYSPQLESFIKAHPKDIDYGRAFKDIFYGVSYPDYIFSLPMGAGKTYLMAAFIYLDLYLASQEPDNAAFAHNFMVLIPSGLKTSIVPSLRHIRDFDPTWIMPDPTASELRRKITFEVLDEDNTSAKSNLVKNPNAQKINGHSPLQDLWGLVAVVNAEKVILDRVDKKENTSLYSREELEKIKVSNELRDIIGRIPSLAVYIDEVHHASDSEIKLRRVVSHWMEKDGVNGVLGFSGTPYLHSTETVTIGGSFGIRSSNISNVVYYYPLADGVGNFLKRPIIKTTDNSQDAIISQAVNEFLDRFGTLKYDDGTWAKLAVYCPSIDNLEEDVYPLVSRIVEDRGMSKTVILPYHKSGKNYKEPEGSAAQFAMLDDKDSEKRIILLVQIGKEGWDCKSLTGVVLPHKSACRSRNMVLQTSCRCLRQVVRGDTEEQALIWLNKDNGDILNDELRRQQDTSIDALNHPKGKRKTIMRYVRRDVPPIDFYQLQIHYDAVVGEDGHDTARLLAGVVPDRDAPMGASLVSEIGADGTRKDSGFLNYSQSGDGGPITLRQWMLLIAKGSFGTLAMSELETYRQVLGKIFGMATRPGANGLAYPRGDIDQERLRSIVRKCFIPKRTVRVRRDILKKSVRILNVTTFDNEHPLKVDDDSLYYPDQTTVGRIVGADSDADRQQEAARRKRETDDALKAIETIRKLNMPGAETTIRELTDKVRTLEANDDSMDKTYHYIPYHFDSGFELRYFSQLLLPDVGGRPLEVYYNGDRHLTDFHIECYAGKEGEETKVGSYTPDFLMLQRGGDGSVDKVLIIETKGQAYADNFKAKRAFMEDEFVKMNYKHFDFLYLEHPTMTDTEQRERTLRKIQDFFNLK